MKPFPNEGKDLTGALRRGEITVAVYGLGHVGAPLLAAWLLAGARGIGVDVDPEKVDLVNSGKSPVMEPGVDEVFSKAVEEGRLRATTSGADAASESDVMLIAVPTKLSGDGWPRKPDLTHVKEVAREIGKGLQKGDLVILESSSPPGTTRKVLKPILEDESGLKAEEDFGLVYSPERIAEGRALKDIVESYPKVIGGIGPKSSATASELYGVIASKGVIEVSNDLVAEFEKLAEGIYRDVNIALANELAELCRVLGIDYDEVRLAANSQPYSHLHRPGTGVGGLCIPVYPHFLAWVANENSVKLELVKTGRRINEEMPRRVAELVEQGMERLGLKYEVSILGLAFRGDVADSRLSPTYDLIKELQDRGISVKVVHDPLIAEDPLLEELGVGLTKELEKALKAPAVVISTDHSQYRMKASEFFGMGEFILLVDGRHVIEVDEVPRGKAYVGVGRPWIIP